MRVKKSSMPAFVAADLMGFIRPMPIPGHPLGHSGRKALPGQYTKPYKRVVELPAGKRISKGRQARYDKDNGTEGRRDYSAVINAKGQA